MPKKIPVSLAASVLVLLAWLLPALAAQGSPEQVQKLAEKNTIYGIPTGDKSNTLIAREIYCLSNNARTKFADWVAYKLDKKSVTGKSIKERKWKKDPELSDRETLGPKDYYKANKVLDTDRGHQAPLASFKGTKHWRDTNYLSNITPQRESLNRYSWVKLEGLIRDLAEKDTIFVMTGPLYETSMPRLPFCKKAHMIPSGYWKIIAAPAKGDEPIKVVGFIFDQYTKSKSPVKEHVATVNEIEDRSGIDFFSELPNTVEEEIEGKNTLQWQ